MSFVKSCTITISIILALCSCDIFDQIFGGDEKDDLKEDNATQSFTTSSGGTVETPAGAFISVPDGAIPNFGNGDEGEMVFSIEADDDTEIPTPTDENKASRLYNFGPEGFVFAKPVTIGIPVNDNLDLDGKEVTLWRINPGTGDVENYAGMYDPDNKIVTTQTRYFSSWFATWSNYTDKGNGCFYIINNSNDGLEVCVENYNLKYPEDASFIPLNGFNSLWLDSWDHGVGSSNEGRLWLPQGDYTLCLTYEHSSPGIATYYTKAYIDASITKSGSRTIGQSNYNCTQLSLGNTYGGGDGRCNCNPTPTIPVGTGDIQITLTWFNSTPLDLDLWVTDPNSEKCYYANTPIASGGTLDRDNKCYDYQNGRAENIFWDVTPPNGEYIIEVNWFSDCGYGDSSQSYNLRTVINGVAKSYYGTINSGETLEIARIDYTRSNSKVIFKELKKNYKITELPPK